MHPDGILEMLVCSHTDGDFSACIISYSPCYIIVFNDLQIPTYTLSYLSLTTILGGQH